MRVVVALGGNALLRRAVGAADEALATRAKRAAGHDSHLLLEEQLLSELV